MINLKATLVAVLFVFYGLSSHASAMTNSRVTLELGMDNDNGQNYYLSGRHAFENKIVARAGTGESTTEEIFNAKVTSDYWTVGFQSDPSALISIGLDAIHSSQQGGLEIDSLAPVLDVNTLNWNIFISPEQRDISFTTISNMQMSNVQKVTFESNGASAGVSYYGFEPVYLSFYRVTYDYPAQVSTINNRTSLFTFIFGTSVTNQVFALEDERNTLEAGYFFNKASISASTSRGRSIVDQSILTVNRVYFSYDVSHNWVTGASVGDSKIDIDNETTWFGSLSLSYRW